MIAGLDCSNPLASSHAFCYNPGMNKQQTTEVVYERNERGQFVTLPEPAKHHRITTSEKARELLRTRWDAYREAQEQGLMNGASARTAPEAWGRVVEKQTRVAIKGSGHVANGAADFVRKVVMGDAPEEERGPTTVNNVLVLIQRAAAEEAGDPAGAAGEVVEGEAVDIPSVVVEATPPAATPTPGSTGEAATEGDG